ncbi:hypothetical protein F5146DRAFT_1038764 [Armillaria mellea]|nr:hypothetical protein F5146DRAFT_1038764 [Armillaria mellea]
MTGVTSENCGFVNTLLPPNPSCNGLVSELLHGSRPLLDANRAFIDAEITKLQQLKAWYDDQLQEIQLRQSIVLKQLGNHESIYAPIRRLPRDILVEIFHWAWNAWPDARDPEYTSEEPDSLDVNGPLWVLARVCGLWRDTLLASPAPWAWYVVVKAPFPKHTREIMQTYLERTGDHLLKSQIMSLVVQCCHRWKNVCISIDKRPMHYLESISHLPALRAIDMDFEDSINHDYIKCRSDICLMAPQLRQASLPNQGICFVSLPPTVTHYSGSLPRAEDFPLLSQLPNLRTCRLESGRTPAIMGELRQLFQMSVSSITHFFRRSRCRLESFSIRMDILESETSATIHELFSSEACTTVSRLKLELHSIVPHNVADVLASPSILPDLSHLCFCFNSVLEPEVETERSALVDMIRSRCKAGLLKTIELQFEDEESRDIEAEFQTLIGGDLEIREEISSPLHLDYQPFFWNP